MFKVFKYKYLALFPIHGDICYHFKYCLKSISIFLTTQNPHFSTRSSKLPHRFSLLTGLNSKEAPTDSH